MSNKRRSAPLQVPGVGDLSADLQEQLGMTADDCLATILAGEPPSPAQFAKALEQYYTNEPVARLVVGLAEKHIDMSGRLMVEPAGGDGAIAKLLPIGSRVFDADPKAEGIIRADFLALTIDHDGPIAVIGNPPFRLAVPFFNHAASQADEIVMILPRTFRKDSVLRKLNEWFDMIDEIELPPYSFLLEGRRCNIPAVCQVWKKQAVRRRIPELILANPDFRFGDREEAHFAIQRVGANAGRVHHETHRSDQAHLFVVVTEEHRASHVETIMRSLPLATVASNTSSVRSIARSEIFALYAKAVRSISRVRGPGLLARQAACRHAPAAVNPAGRLVSRPAPSGCRRGGEGVRIEVGQLRTSR